MKLRRALTQDLADIMRIFEEAKAFLGANGVDQWQNGYPNAAVVRRDISSGAGLVLLDGGAVAAYLVLASGPEESYREICGKGWRFGGRYMVIHRMAVAGKYRGLGVAGMLFVCCEELAAAAGAESLRIDTHERNAVMRRALEKEGFSECGTIHLADGALRVAYEKQVVPGRGRREGTPTMSLEVEPVKLGPEDL